MHVRTADCKFTRCMNCLQAEGETEVLVPGDTERQHMAACDKQGGIAYQLKQIEWAVSAISYSLPTQTDRVGGEW